MDHVTLLVQALKLTVSPSICHKSDEEYQRMRLSISITSAVIVRLTETHVYLIAMRPLAKHDGQFGTTINIYFQWP